MIRTTPFAWNDSRRRLAVLALMGAMVAPAAAQAETKFDNEKANWTSAAPCGQAFVAPAAASPLTARDRSRLILGGAPSALDRIRASQAVGGEGGADPTPVRETAALTAPLVPASRFPIALSPLRGGACADDIRALPKMRRQVAPFAGAVVAGAVDPSDELGTRAIPIKKTRFDQRWDRVRRAPSAALMRTQLARADASASLPEAELLGRVNAWVNRQIAYRGDDLNYRQRDHWATAEQTLARGAGDCEDYAILKMHMLRAAGVDPARMKLVLLRDLAANADHAFLLVETGAGRVVLDNTTDRVYSGAEAVAVRPVLSFSEGRRWVHAYRGASPSPVVAAVPAAPKSVALAFADQRSLRAEPLTFKTGFSK